jgi:hypothetical protein
MNVEIGTEAAQFPEKEYIIGNFVAVQTRVTIRRYILYICAPSLILLLFLSFSTLIDYR